MDPVFAKYIGAGLACLYKALAVGKMGLTAPLSAVITALIPTVFSFSTAGLPRGAQLVGFALAILSIWLIAARSGSAGESAGLGLAVAAGVGFGGFLLFIKFAGTHTVFWPLVAARSASLGLMILILVERKLSATAHKQFHSGQESWKPVPGVLGYVLLAGMLDSGANALYVAATQHGRLDVAAVLSSLYPASTVIFARLVLKERWSRLLHRHTSALPPAKAVAVASSVASTGSSISLCALPEGIIGKQFSSAATRQSNSTGRLTLIISLIAPSRSPGFIA